MLLCNWFSIRLDVLSEPVARRSEPQTTPCTSWGAGGATPVISTYRNPCWVNVGS
jgi:hypothetical protein